MYRKYSKDLGNKEFLLNYTNRRWGLTKTNKVGEVMALIRTCQPRTFHEWSKWYFSNAKTNTKNPQRISEETLYELGERLYVKLKEIVIPEVEAAIKGITFENCIDYIYNLVINRTYDGFINEKFIVIEKLGKRFPSIIFEETDPMLDHAGDIDYIGQVGKKCFGIQIKPITASASLGNYDVSARMKQSFDDFTDKFSGNVFIVFSDDQKIVNQESLYSQIDDEIKRLRDTI